MVTSFNPYFVGKIARAFSLVRFESSKKLANFVFVKLQTAITFAPVIRIAIIIYVFGVEKNLPCHGSPT